MLKLLIAGGIVSVPLLLFSLCSVALIIERCRFWYVIRSREKRIINDALRSYSHEEPTAAIQRLQKNNDLPGARILIDALTLPESSHSDFRLAIDTAFMAEWPVYRRFQTPFQTIVAIAPLLGLLGTILGLMQSFSAIDLSQASVGETAVVTAGIGEALISTVFGIVVAVFTLLFANTFRSLASRQLAFIQSTAGQFELAYRRIHTQENS